MSEGAKLWIETVKSHCNKSFKTIIIRTRKIRQSAADKLISERNKLLRQGNIKDSKNLDVKIAQIISEEGRVRAFMFKKYTDTSHSACLSEMWKIKKEGTNTSFIKNLLSREFNF